MRFALDARVGATKIKIPYPVAGSMQVYADGVKKAYTPWDDTINSAAVLTKQQGCGENRFVGVDNFLEFYITPGCLIEIEPKDAIMTRVRMDWSLSAFYSNGGTTMFADRLAASLGIPSYRVKIVAVYEGSVVCETMIVEEDEEEEEAIREQKEANGEVVDENPAPAVSLEDLLNTLVEQAESGDLDVGAPVMGISNMESNETLAGDPVPEPPSDEDDSAYTLVSLWIAVVALLATLM